MSNVTSDNDELVGYFGFGSLVNKHTLRTDYVGTYPATLKGWRRHWQARSSPVDADVALLSVHRDEACDIQGALVIDLAANLPKVDERERGYVRHQLEPKDIVIPSGLTLPDQLYVYVADAPLRSDDKSALLQSYLDAVLQGFYLVYGADGVRHFTETTMGFRRAMIADRNAPLYPRSVTLNNLQMDLFDTELHRAGVIPLDPDSPLPQSGK